MIFLFLHCTESHLDETITATSSLKEDTRFKRTPCDRTDALNACRTYSDRNGDFNKTFVIIIGVGKLREISRDSSNQRKLHSESAVHENLSNGEQIVRTPEKSIKHMRTKSVTISKWQEIYEGIEVELSGGLQIPLVNSKSRPTAKTGFRDSLGETVTNSISNEIDVTIPSRDLKCRPGCKVEIIWNFYTAIDHIRYLVDLEVDPYNSYIGNTLYLNPNFSAGIDKSSRTCTPLSLVETLDSDRKNTFERMWADHNIVKEGGKYILKDFPIEIDVDTYNSTLHTKGTTKYQRVIRTQ